MCGILFTNIESIGKSRFIESLNLMSYRGPDSQGYYEHNKVKMGHNRLKILDLDDRSNQPFPSHCGRYLCIFNGEIYNYRELAKQHKIGLKTTSDTELLIELYVLHKEGMLTMLNGMFAFIIYDLLDNSYFVARDRLGIKPLYIYSSSAGIAISSEVNALLNFLLSNQIDEIGLRQFKKLRTFFDNRTLYKNVYMFPAGHYFQSGTELSPSNCTRYWTLDFTLDKDIDDEEVEFLLKSAVQYRNISDVPVGTYLSGGLDSTILTALAKQTHSWTVGFEDNNEFEYSQIAAKKYGVSHHEIIVDYENFIPSLNEIIKIRKEPLSVPNEVLLYLLTKQVKKENTVVLSGEGADELFFGYDKIFWWAHTADWSVEGFDKFYSYGSGADLEIVEEVMSKYNNYSSPLEKISAFFQRDHLHGLLRRLDSSTMLNSVEARVPFVDHRLIELMASATFNYRSDHGQVVKAPLKRIFSSIIPDEVIYRKKIGFPVPLDKIFKSSDLQPMDAWLDHNLNYLINKVL